MGFFKTHLSFIRLLLRGLAPVDAEKRRGEELRPWLTTKSNRLEPLFISPPSALLFITLVPVDSVLVVCIPSSCKNGPLCILGVLYIGLRLFSSWTLTPIFKSVVAANIGGQEQYTAPECSTSFALVLMIEICCKKKKWIHLSYMLLRVQLSFCPHHLYQLDLRMPPREVWHVKGSSFNLQCVFMSEDKKQTTFTVQ